MPMTEKQTQRLEGILAHLTDFLDKRFAQARRIHPAAGRAEADMRLHQMAAMRDVLLGTKGYGPIRIPVSDILTGSDEDKKGDLFSATDQNSLMNEVIPTEDDSGGERTTGRLPVRSVRTLYAALDPSLESLLTLIQVWTWWDLRGAAERYRFDEKLELIESLKTIELTEERVERYRKDMGAKPGIEIKRQDLMKFELGATHQIIALFEGRFLREEGHQMITAAIEQTGNPEADAACIQLAKRLTARDKIRVLQDPLDDNIRQYYASQMGIPAEKVTARGAEDFETRLADRERQTLSEKMSGASSLGKTVNYKEAVIAEMRERFEAVCASMGIKGDVFAQKK
jgi:hypothetical protein